MTYDTVVVVHSFLISCSVLSSLSLYHECIILSSDSIMCWLLYQWCHWEAFHGCTSQSSTITLSPSDTMHNVGCRHHSSRTRTTCWTSRSCEWMDPSICRFLFLELCHVGMACSWEGHHRHLRLVGHRFKIDINMIKHVIEDEGSLHTSYNRELNLCLSSLLHSSWVGNEDVRLHRHT